ncbi:T9SS type A sorting domain-containing protein [Mesohalobacter halotolerans]|uniref:T9SS type A sorting domain-containing protein n=1 Tax=Mesohalobacter halotolerans TaxID=1883405 RepID=A0A4U5TSX9_9FLAO|nr:T9SS type A sorting domain-containing protein [Mesohalobacter halotolerans]TKS57457.1 T9SS type A sorting domain-containing protein [Mesohalobacter halotolerans]
MNGFDATISGNPSLKLFDNSTQTWGDIPNTNSTNLEVGKAYNLFVRGDRSIDLTSTNQIPTNTILRATGNLVTGNVDLTADLATGNGEWSLLGNPYQAIVDFNSLTFSGDINSNNLYIWNANASTEGAYEIIDNTTPAQQMIQPGQSFFVQNSATVTTTPGLEFTETAKNTSGMLTSVFDVSQIAIADLELYNTNNIKLDVVKFRFEAGANNAIDDFDGGKLANPTENLAAVNSNTLLGLERRDFPQDNEILPLFISQYQFNQYEFRLNTSNWDENIDVYIVDNYLNTETLIGDNQAYSFSVDSNIPESIASDRFSLKFDNTTLSVDYNALAEGFNLYPNPTSNGLFSIKTKGLNAQSASVKIYSLAGQEVFNTSIVKQGNDEFNVDASQLSTGVYLLEFLNAEQSISRKLIIQ